MDIVCHRLKIMMKVFRNLNAENSCFMILLFRSECERQKVAIVSLIIDDWHGIYCIHDKIYENFCITINLSTISVAI